MYPIVRMFEDEQQAQAAAAKLNEKGFPASGIQVVASKPAADSETVGSGGDALLAGYSLGMNTRMVSQAHVEACADGLRQGRSVVIVQAPFGYSQKAQDVLEGFDPVDTHLLTAPKEPPLSWDDSAPVSSALRMPVLLKDSPAPFSDFIGVPATSHGRSWMARAFGELAPKFSFSGLFGMKLLSKNPTPLSSLVGMKTLSTPKTTRTSSFGLPLLSKGATPLSSRLGLKTVTRRKGNWTHSFGLPLLLRD